MMCRGELCSPEGMNLLKHGRPNVTPATCHLLNFYDTQADTWVCPYKNNLFYNIKKLGFQRELVPFGRGLGDRVPQQSTIYTNIRGDKFMADFLDKICGCVWGNGLIFLLLSTGIIYTVKLKFIQFRLFPFLIKSAKSGNKNSGLSQFKTVCMSLGTAMGTGNITGVASALSIGGAGAVFWMWVSAFFGMALVYAENSLSVLYTDSHSKGSVAYMEKGLNSRTLAVIFAVFCILACIGMGGMVQVNTFSESLTSCTGVNRSITALAVFLLIFAVIKGGAERIGTVSQVLLPVASLLYICVCSAVIFRFRHGIPLVFRQIFTQAFGIRQSAGGISGYMVSRAVSAGMKRGIFSNEAGLGSSPILHSASESSDSQLQGMWSMFEVFFDTVICCTLTAVTILCSAPDLSVSTAFSSVLGNLSPFFLTAEIMIFSFCTVIGWYYCGHTAFSFISGNDSHKITALAFSFAVSLGAVFTVKTVWTLSDIFNGLMAFPNLTALLLLMKKVKRE